jgi:UDP-N-acetylmuramoyl-L-alanyl-D-glutamate--2,6-diaminopimelate ligase
MRAAMEIARGLLAGSGRLLVVTGAAGERDPGRRTAVGAAVASADAIWIADEDPRFEDPDLIATAIGAAIAAERSGAGAATTIEHDRRAAINAAIGEAKPGDVVLLAGKGHERTIERRGADEPWDEAAVAREALRSLGYPRDR